LIVIPGYLRSHRVIDKWAKIGYSRKVMLVTDFANLETPDEILDMFCGANLTSADPYKANVIMICNYITGRAKNTELGEEDLYMSGSVALAGKMYSTELCEQVGELLMAGNDVTGLRLHLLESEIAQLSDLGLVPIAKKSEKIIACSARTLYMGDNVIMQTYPVVRVADFISKVLIDNLSKCNYMNWNVQTQKQVRTIILALLDNMEGEDNLIKKYELLRFETLEKERFLDVAIIPHTVNHSFLISLVGREDHC
jgi:hypothetical protein